MTRENDDPRLTAYALGELTSEERAEIAALLASDARARGDVEAIREVGARLERGLSARGGPVLSSERRARILAAAEPHGAGTRRTSPAAAAARRPGVVAVRRRKAWLLLAAFVPVLGVFAGVMSGSSQDPEPVAPARGVPASLSLAVPSRAATSAASGVVGRSTALRAAARQGPMNTLVPTRGPLLQDGAEAFFAGAERPERWGEASRFQRDSHDALVDNPFVRVATDARSTFSIDVDTASYALVRRLLLQGQLPPKGAVRIEEMINYFSYDYPEPRPTAPFSVVTDVARAPWAPAHQLVRIGLKARHVSNAARPAANLVFLIDVSGSMESSDKLPLVKYGLQRLVEALEARDRVSVVVYAGASGLVLDAVPGHRREEILDAVERLTAGGSTNGGQGIELAYALARKHFIGGGVNRVILATDGDFNVGVTNQSDLVELITRQAKTGVYLSVLGVGLGNYQDSTLERLADRGNGNYAYIDDRREAHKVLVQQTSGTLVTVAKDVKLQLEFNPGEVEAYRLIGYENRVLQHADFNDDARDAGEIGADHRVTALYELIPAGGAAPGAGVDELKYQAPAPSGRTARRGAFAGELLHVKLRYQAPEGGPSELLEVPVRNTERVLEGDFRFAAAVAELGMLLRASPWRGTSSYDGVLDLARSALGTGSDREAREELLTLVTQAREADRRGSEPPVLDPLDTSMP